MCGASLVIQGIAEKANISTMNLSVGAGVGGRFIFVHAIHHDKFVVVDSQTGQTGAAFATRSIAAASLHLEIGIFGSCMYVKCLLMPPTSNSNPFQHSIFDLLLIIFANLQKMSGCLASKEANL